MDVPGENLKGVYSANEYLTRVNLMGAWNPGSETPVLHGQRVVVVGGGNVAMDAVRTARRLGAEEAVIVYRRGRDELPARAEEAHHAEQEGIRFDLQVAPLEVLGDEAGWVRALRCIRMELGEPDASGRARPTPIAGSEFEIPCEMVVVAIGTRSNPLLTSTAPELEVSHVRLHHDRRVRHDEHGRCLRRRRHRPRRRHGHPRDGRRQARRRGDRPLADDRVGERTGARRGPGSRTDDRRGLTSGRRAMARGAARSRRGSRVERDLVAVAAISVEQPGRFRAVG